MTHSTTAVGTGRPLPISQLETIGHGALKLMVKSKHCSHVPPGRLLFVFIEAVTNKCFLNKKNNYEIAKVIFLQSAFQSLFSVRNICEKRRDQLCDKSL